MPDESCRKCGGMLTSCSSCQECRKITQRICTDCGSKTEEQFHDSCLRVESIKIGTGMQMNIASKNQTNHMETIKNVIVTKSSLLDAILVFSIVGFFVLGFAAGGYLEMFESNTGIESIPLDKQIQPQSAPSHILYENCLGYGNAQSIAVKCPDGKGSVYNAVLDLPYDLDKKFSKDIFSIRGISLGKNLDGSLELKYQNTWYHTDLLYSKD